MKRITASLVLLILLFQMCSCGRKDNSDTHGSTEDPLESMTDIQHSTTIIDISPPEPSESEPVTDSENESAAAMHKPAVLMYHLIMETPYNDLEALFVRPDDFRAHIEILKNEGYEFLFADDYNMTVKPSVMLTFDDGYEDNYTTMFPILKENGAKATVFLITDLIGTPGYLSKAQIKEMSDSGLVYFGCHTASHRDLSTQSEERIRSEFTESISVIEGLTGRPCKALAYPAGGHNSSVTAIADEYFDFAYISRPVIPDGIETNMKIPRYYISRGMGANNVLNMIRP